MTITATVQSQPITASVSSTGVAVSVGSSVVSASANGGIGPQGPAGTDGGPLEQLSNVAISGAADGDVLQYGSGQWRNNAILDGGNW